MEVCLPKDAPSRTASSTSSSSSRAPFFRLCAPRLGGEGLFKGERKRESTCIPQQGNRLLPFSSPSPSLCFSPPGFPFLLLSSAAPARGRTTNSKRRAEELPAKTERGAMWDLNDSPPSNAAAAAAAAAASSRFPPYIASQAQSWLQKNGFHSLARPT